MNTTKKKGNVALTIKLKLHFINFIQLLISDSSTLPIQCFGKEQLTK